MADVATNRAGLHQGRSLKFPLNGFRFAGVSLWQISEKQL